MSCRDEGTDRSHTMRGQVGIGAMYAPSEISAARMGPWGGEIEAVVRLLAKKS